MPKELESPRLVDPRLRSDPSLMPPRPGFLPEPVTPLVPSQQYQYGPAHLAQAPPSSPVVMGQQYQYDPTHLPQAPPFMMAQAPPLFWRPHPQHPHFPLPPNLYFPNGGVRGHPQMGTSYFTPPRGPMAIPIPQVGVAPSDPRGGHSGQDPFVEEWLRKASENVPDDSKRNKPVEFMKVPEVRSQLMKGVELLARLRSTHQELSVLSDGDTGQLTTLQTRAGLDREAFLCIRATLDTPGLKEHLARKMSRIRSKRERSRKRWRERRESRQEAFQLADAAAEKWVKGKQQEMLKAKMEKSVQASASGLLEEVKKKKTDIKQLLELCEALKELRALRREASRKKGDAPPIEADEKFQRTHEDLVDMLTKQCEVYEQEDHALRVLMEEEVLEKLQSHQNKAAEVAEPTSPPTPAPWDPPLLPSTPWAPPLFPPAPTVPPVTSWESAMEFYLQAKTNEDIRRAIRSDWDRYISPGGGPGESGDLDAPLDLTAPPPSSPAWAQYCSTPILTSCSPPTPTDPEN